MLPIPDLLLKFVIDVHVLPSVFEVIALKLEVVVFLPTTNQLAPSKSIEVTLLLKADWPDIYTIVQVDKLVDVAIKPLY
jgi:hypothetical protein